jgi:hypothetical protein
MIGSMNGHPVQIDRKNTRSWAAEKLHFLPVILAQPFEVVILAQPESPYLSLLLLLFLRREQGASAP